MFDIIAFRLGPVVIYGWGLAAALGALLAYALLIRCTRRAGLGKSMAQRLMLWAMPLGVFFARLVYCLVRYEQVFYDPLEGRFLGMMPLIRIDQGGLSIMGMLLGVFLAAFVVSRLAGQPFLALADAMALPLALFCAIVLMGQILGGEGYGGNVAEPRWQFFSHCCSKCIWGVVGGCVHAAGVDHAADRRAAHPPWQRSAQARGYGALLSDFLLRGAGVL